MGPVSKFMYLQELESSSQILSKETWFLVFKRLDKIRVKKSKYSAMQPALCEVAVVS